MDPARPLHRRGPSFRGSCVRCVPFLFVYILHLFFACGHCVLFFAFRNPKSIFCIVTQRLVDSIAGDEGEKGEASEKGELELGIIVHEDGELRRERKKEGEGREQQYREKHGTGSSRREQRHRAETHSATGQKVSVAERSAQEAKSETEGAAAMRRIHSHPRRAERAAIQNRRHPKRIHRSRRPHRPRTMPARGRNANARPTTISRDNHLRSPYNSRSSGRLLSPLVSMSTSAVSCSSCTLIMRWTMGTSRPGSLYTTMSPDTKGVLYRLDKSRRSPR